MNFYKRHLGDIAKALGHLSQGEMGAYDLLLDWCYANEKPLPDRKGDTYRIGRAASKAERGNVDRILADFFVLGDDGYTQKRVLEEISKANDQADTNRRIAEEREAKRRARTEHEACTNRSTKQQPSQTPDTRLHKQQDLDQKQKGDKSPLVFPEWLPEQAWAEWHKFRNSRKGWTPKARELSLSTLTKLRTKGHDPTAVIEQSIERGWTGLFEIKPEVTHGNDQSSRRESTAERAARFAREGDEREDARNAASARQGHAKILAADGSDIRSSLDVRVR